MTRSAQSATIARPSVRHDAIGAERSDRWISRFGTQIVAALRLRFRLRKRDVVLRRTRPACLIYDTPLPALCNAESQHPAHDPPDTPPLPSYRSAASPLPHRLSTHNTQKTLALFPSGCYNAKSYGGVAQLVERCVRNA